MKEQRLNLFLHSNCHSMKTFLFVILMLSLFRAYTQNNTIDSLQKVLQPQKEDTNKVNTLTYLSFNYWLAGDYKNTMQNAKTAVALSTKLNYKSGEGDGYLNIGLAYGIKKDRTTELEYLNKALTLYKEAGEKRNISNCYDWIAQVYKEEDDYGKALEIEYTAQKIREQIGDKETIADGFASLASAYYSLRNDSEMFKNSLAALKLYKETNNKSGIGICYFMIGGAYYGRGNFSEALNKYFEALQYLKDQGKPNDIANIYALIADAYEKQGDSDYNNHNIPASLKKYQEAEKNQLISLKMWQAIPYKISIALCFLNLGEINIKLKNLNIARKYFDSSLSISQLVDLKSGLRDIYNSFSTLDSIQGNYKEAYKNYKLSVTYRDGINAEESDKKAVQAQMQY